MTTGLSQLLTIEQAAKILGVHPKSIRRYITKGDLPAYRIAGARLIKIRRDDLEALLQPITEFDEDGAR